VSTSALGVTGIIRAWIAVIAIRCDPGRTTAINADVSQRTEAAVVARSVVVGVDTAGERVARVVGAQVLVVTIQGYSGLADARGAGVPRGAGIAIAAQGVVIDMHAARVHITGIIGTDVAIIAVNHRPRLASPLTALVVRRANVAVTARSVIAVVLATCIRVAVVCGADVAVITIQPAGTGTTPPLADVLCGALVASITQGRVALVEAPGVRAA